MIVTTTRILPTRRLPTLAEPSRRAARVGERRVGRMRVVVTIVERDALRQEVERIRDAAKDPGAETGGRGPR